MMTSADIQIKREATDEIMKEEVEDYNMSKETIMVDEDEVTAVTEEKDSDLIDMFKGHPNLQNGGGSAIVKNNSSPETVDEAVDYTLHRREDGIEDTIHRGLFQCSQCNFRTENEQEYFHHSEEHAPDRDFICIVCNRKFSKKQSLRRHMNLHSGHRPFKCPLCEYRSSRKDHLQLHLRTRHAPGKATNYQFKCVICGNSYQSQKRMIMHMKSHQRTHRCDICGMTFPSFTAMDSHKKAKHVMPTTPVSNGNPYTCHACGFMSTSAQGYHIHLQSQRHKDVITASVRIPQVIKSSMEEELKIRDDRIDVPAVTFPGPIPISMRPLLTDGPQRLPPTLTHLHNPRIFPHHQLAGPHFPIRPEFFSPVFGFPRPDFPRPEFRTEHKSTMPVIVADVSSLRLSPAVSETISTGSPSQSVSPSYNRPGSPNFNTTSPTSSPLMQMPGLLMKTQDSPRSVYVTSASPVSPQYNSVNATIYSQADEASPKSESKSRTSSFDSGNDMRPEPTQYNMATSSGTRDTATQDDVRRCKHCHTVYSDDVMFGIHLGCHGVNHPFECNICGHICCDKYDFATHITRSLHKK